MRLREIRRNEEVDTALHDRSPIVALESTVYSRLGLPDPDNRHALERSIAAIEAAGAVPALTAILDGEPWCGAPPESFERILEGTAKTAERDLSVAIGQRWPVGVTTVSASLALAAMAGVRVFATGGIGGVHREAALTGDISADLEAIARQPVATVSAGAKSFLDLPATLERLETLGVPVLGWQTDEFPAFTARSSGIELGVRIDDLTTLRDVVASQLDFGRGLLVVNPVPAVDALDQETHDRALSDALAEVVDQGISGPAVTPFVLDRIVVASGGRSVPANLSLVENNAKLAAQLANALSADSH